MTLTAESTAGECPECGHHVAHGLARLLIQRYHKRLLVSACLFAAYGLTFIVLSILTVSRNRTSYMPLPNQYVHCETVSFGFPFGCMDERVATNLGPDGVPYRYPPRRADWTIEDGSLIIFPRQPSGSSSTVSYRIHMQALLSNGCLLVSFLYVSQWLCELYDLLRVRRLDQHRRCLWCGYMRSR